MVVTTGFFDGVHLGHRLVIERLVSLAKETGEESLVISFWPHPRSVLQKTAGDIRLLTTIEEKKAILKSLGVDRVEILPFTMDFSKLTMRDFLRDYVMGKYGGSVFVLGYDNRVGCDCTGSEDVVRMASEIGLRVEALSMLPSDSGNAVSSTKIRAALEAGKVEVASAMLGYDYSVKGVVVGGKHLGRTLGFPTANIQLCEPLKALPANGVYMVKVEILGETFYGMCNIGTRPTVSSGSSRSIETNIFDFGRDIYGLDMRIHFLSRIRDEKRFENTEVLSRQLEMDRRACLESLKRKTAEA